MFELFKQTYKTFEVGRKRRKKKCGKREKECLVREDNCETKRNETERKGPEGAGFCFGWSFVYFQVPTVLLFFCWK